MWLISEFMASVSNNKPKSFPKYPEDPYYCSFNIGDTVWIRRSVQSEWQLGQITDKDPSPRNEHRVFYTVEYVLPHPSQSNASATSTPAFVTARDMFDPLDGFIKPENKDIRDLLKNFGYLPSEVEQAVQLFDVLAREDFDDA